MNQPITVKDKQFILSISNEEIQNSIQKVADRINADYAGKEIFFIGVLINYYPPIMLFIPRALSAPRLNYNTIHAPLLGKS